ncbi:MAG: type III pantothenate kinase [Clostridia bacterium]|nr:type III pantothenate kinase [Clostridia bacterium]
MVLLLDVGNTNIKIGVVIEDKIVRTWRIATDHNKTADEYGMVFLELLSSVGYHFDQVEGIIISSVAPALNYTIEHMCSYYTKRKPIMVNSSINTGIKIKYLVPEELGADRIVNAVAAYTIYGGPCITVDFGSATTFGMIDDKGNFLGGAIAPGIKSSAESLTKTAAKLPRIELLRPRSIIGKTTVENMQAGVIYGFSGLVEGIIREMITESGFRDVKVIATGGMSQLLTSGSAKYFNVIDRSLSLKGLKVLYDLNKGERS